MRSDRRERCNSLLTEYRHWHSVALSDPVRVKVVAACAMHADLIGLL